MNATRYRTCQNPPPRLHNYWRHKMRPLGVTQRNRDGSILCVSAVACCVTIYKYENLFPQEKSHFLSKICSIRYILNKTSLIFKPYNGFSIWNMIFFLAYAVRTLPLFFYSPLVNLIFVRITEREEYYNGIYWSSATFVQVLGYRIYWIEILSFNNSRCTAVSYFVTVVTHAWCPVKWTLYWDCR